MSDLPQPLLPVCCRAWGPGPGVRRMCAVGLFALGVLGAVDGLHAQTQPPAGAASPVDSRISAVTVYPGTAVIERVLHVGAGTRRVELACLPATLDVASLRVEAELGVQVGAITTRVRPRQDSPGCRGEAEDQRIRELEAQIAQLDAERGGHELVLGYLRAQGVAGAASDAGRGAAAPSAAALQSMAEGLRRLGQDALQSQARLVPRRAELALQLRQLVEERDRLRPSAGPVLTLTLPLRASREADVRVQYQVRGPSWSPAYRATLDADAPSVALERQALVSQATGEDWRGVALKLSTGRPQAAVEPAPPRPWQVGIYTPPPPRPAAPAMAAAPAPAPAMAARLSGMQADAAFEPVQAVDTAFATEFIVPGTVDVASGGERVQFTLGSASLPARLLLRVHPLADAAAYLIAETTLPAGVWPAGPVSLLRGSQPVGRTTLNPDAVPLALPFGRDEQVRVQVNPGLRKAGSSGFIGSKAEQRIERAYVVENRRRQAVRLQVLEASPVSTDERVEVQRRFVPEPQVQAWQDKPGVVAWEQDLAAGASARFSAEYVLTHPKDLRLSETK